MLVQKRDLASELTLVRLLRMHLRGAWLAPLLSVCLPLRSNLLLPLPLTLLLLPEEQRAQRVQYQDPGIMT